MQESSEHLNVEPVGASPCPCIYASYRHTCEACGHAAHPFSNCTGVV